MKFLKASVRVCYLFGIEIIGWCLILAGIAALVLPGPGILLLFAGIVVLSNRYTWAGKLRHRAQGWAEESTRASVETKKRIAFSFFTSIVVISIGVYVMQDPTLPPWIDLDIDLKITEIIIGPKIPGAGLFSGIVLVISGFIAISLVSFGIVKYRNRTE